MKPVYLTFSIAVISSIAALVSLQAQIGATPDATFVRAASAGGLAEVRLGKLAQEKGSSESVKAFGARMVADHTKINDELKELASAQGMPVATSMNAKDQAVWDTLSSLPGTQFDHAYIQAMIEDHKQDVADFQKEASVGQDPKVKAFALRTLPTLKEHLNMAETIGKEMQIKTGGE